VRPGDVLLTAGTRLTTAHIGSLAAMGYTAVSVRRQPRAAVISTAMNWCLRVRTYRWAKSAM
jgi:molybdopterin molybdotransferase